MQAEQFRILILDDTEADAQAMRQELQQAGWAASSLRVSSRADFVQALRSDGGNGPPPEVILADDKAADLDVVDALSIRQLLCPDTPFLVVARELGEARAVQLLKAGATDCLPKSDLSRLVPAIERARAEAGLQRDRRRIASELHAERRLLSAVLDSTAALIALLDAQGRLVRINAAAAAACGISETHARGRLYAELFAEAAQQAGAQEAVMRLLDAWRDSGDRPAPWRETTRLGRTVLWSASLMDGPGSGGECLVLAGIDISAQQSDEEMRARLATIVDSTEDAILSKTLAGEITSWNRGAERVYGYCADEVLGRSVLMLVPPGQEAEEQAILARVATGKPVHHYETLRRRKDGQVINVSITISPMRDAHGVVTSVCSIARDVSEQKRLEAMRRQSAALQAENQRVQEASRLKSEFLTHMSHELRTPLNAVIGFAELLHAGLVPPGSARHHEFLGHIATSGRHLLQLINNILDLSKVEAGKLEFHPEPVDLARTVHEVVATLGSTAAARQVAWQLDLDPALGPLWLDPARLKQVLYNYLSNAIKFSPEGGCVLVRTRADTAGTFRIDVEDQGIGIEARDLPRLFVEFEQIEPGRQRGQAGSGLGLALTRRLVEAQGGSVGVHSEPGRGSVFHARLPRHADGQSARTLPRSWPALATPRRDAPAAAPALPSDR